MTNIDSVLAQVDANFDDSLKRLITLVGFKSISTDPAYKEECQKAADWIAKELNGIGIDTRVHQTPGHPMVVGHDSDTSAKPGPHVLFYAHYDVQPVDPLELWDDDPFNAKIFEKDGV